MLREIPFHGSVHSPRACFKLLKKCNACKKYSDNKYIDNVSIPYFKEQITQRTKSDSIFV